MSLWAVSYEHEAGHWAGFVVQERAFFSRVVLRCGLATERVPPQAPRVIEHREYPSRNR